MCTTDEQGKNRLRDALISYYFLNQIINNILYSNRVLKEVSFALAENLIYIGEQGLRNILSYTP